MSDFQFIFSDGLVFPNRDELLEYLSRELSRRAIVEASHQNALADRERRYPTGIVIDDCAIAIPHCEPEHTIRPAVFVLRLGEPVEFRQADDDVLVKCSMIFALAIEKSVSQVKFLRPLFRCLQTPGYLRSLLLAKNVRELENLFLEKVAPVART